MFDNLIPYTNIHELNLDWIIKKVKEYTESVDVLKIDFEDLKEYVDDFIDDIDIQNAVNNKLDVMYQNGQLYDLIVEFLTTESLLTFDTKNAMKNGQNLANGVPVLTLGTTTYDDKRSTLYRVRQLTSSDVIDNDNIVALTNYPTLIAQKLIQHTEPRSKYYLFIGDSYANRENSWVDRVASLLGLTSSDFTALRISGSGFLKDNYNYGTFQQNMENADIPDKSIVTDIIVCGGANDRTYTQTEVDTAIGEFCTSAKTNYPNAQVYIGMIAWSVKPSEYESLNAMFIAYSLCNKYGAIYLSGVEHALHRGVSSFEDDFHPNATGQAYLSKAIYQAYKSGYYDEDLVFRNQSISSPSTVITNETYQGTIDIYHSGHNDIMNFKGRSYIEGSFNRNTWYKLGAVSNTFIFGGLASENPILAEKIGYARDSSTNTYEFVKLEITIIRQDAITPVGSTVSIRFLSPTVATASEIYIGPWKITLNSMTQR